MAHQVVWPQMNVFSEEGVPTVLKRGQMLPDGVDDTQLETLMVIGAIKPVETTPPADETSEESADSESAPEMLQKPSPDDPKSAWEAYASDERNPDRIPATQAKSMSKTALMDRYK